MIEILITIAQLSIRLRCNSHDAKARRVEELSLLYQSVVPPAWMLFCVINLPFYGG